jgi:hypothetical protein
LELNKTLGPNERFLIAVIDSLCARGEACFAGNEYLAHRLNVTLKHMNNMLADLTTGGFLIRLKFTGRRTLRCVHSDLSSDPGCVRSLLARYNAQESCLPKNRYADLLSQKTGMQPPLKNGSQTSYKKETEDKVENKEKTTMTRERAQASPPEEESRRRFSFVS